MKFILLILIIQITPFANSCGFTTPTNPSIYINGVNSQVFISIDGSRYGPYTLNGFQTQIIHLAITYNQLVEFEVTASTQPDSISNIPGFIATIYYMNDNNEYEEIYSSSTWFAGPTKAKEIFRSNTTRAEYLYASTCGIDSNAYWIWDYNYSKSVTFTTLIREANYVDFKVNVDDYLTGLGIQDDNGNVIHSKIDFEYPYKR